MARKCSTCGAPLGAGTSFCNFCKAEVEVAPPSIAYGPPPPMPYGPPPSMPYAQPFAPPVERPLLSEPGLVVTTARFVVGHQTYPIQGIATVAPYTVAAKRVANYVVGGFFAFSTFGNCVGTDLAENGAGGKIVTMFFTAGIAALAFWLAKQKKDTHGIMLATSAGGRIQAFMTQDGPQMVRVLGALNQAIASR